MCAAFYDLTYVYVYGFQLRIVPAVRPCSHGSEAYAADTV